jgi:hypothetical protein
VLDTQSGANVPRIALGLVRIERGIRSLRFSRRMTAAQRRRRCSR